MSLKQTALIAKLYVVHVLMHTIDFIPVVLVGVVFFWELCDHCMCVSTQCEHPFVICNIIGH